MLVTTLIDASPCSVADLTDQYAQRWRNELDIRGLKTHMQMEHMRCKCPSVVRIEIYDHMIAFHFIRDLVVRRVLRHSTAPKHLSHTGAAESHNAFLEKLQAGGCRIETLEGPLMDSIIGHPVADRKPRFHPREINRRPKHYKFADRPRHAARRPAA